MTIKDRVGAVEAIIFASGEPIATDKLMSILDIDEKELKYISDMLEEKYGSKESGIKLIHLEDSLQFCSNTDYIEQVREVMELKKNNPLSNAALEVLSLVAYNQPVTKAFIEQVRGVDCSGVVASLTQKGLISECGRLELPGKPLLYGTTDNFLRSMQISSLSQLPELPKQQENINNSADESPLETSNLENDDANIN